MKTNINAIDKKKAPIQSPACRREDNWNIGFLIGRLKTAMTSCTMLIIDIMRNPQRQVVPLRHKPPTVSPKLIPSGCPAPISVTAILLDFFWIIFSPITPPAATKHIEFAIPPKARKAISADSEREKLQPKVMTVCRRLPQRYIYVPPRCSVRILIIRNVEPLVKGKIVEGLVV